MGYFGNGFVFTAEPPWPALAAALPDSIALRAYRHRNEPLWLLDAWGHSFGRHCPFTEKFPDQAVLSAALPQETTALLQTFSEICSALAGEERPYGSGWLRSCAQMSLLAGTAAFFFAADDEENDLACVAARGRLERFLVRFELCAVEYSDGGWVVVPLEYAEDPELKCAPEGLAALSRIPGVTVGPVRTIEDGRPFYGNAVQLWPAGDPAALLGVGTWDPFEHVDRDYSVAFERVPSGTPPKPASPAATAGTQVPGQRADGEAGFGELYRRQLLNHGAAVLITTLVVAAVVAGYWVVQHGVAEDWFIELFLGAALVLHAVRALIWTVGQKIGPAGKQPGAK